MSNVDDDGWTEGESETLSLESSVVSEEENFRVPLTRWDDLFTHCCDGDVDGLGSLTLEDVVRMEEEARGGGDGNIASLEGILALPTLNTSLYKNKGFVRVDIDSIKGLVHLEDTMNIFHPNPERQRGAFFLEQECPLSFTICCVLSKNTEHMNGLGFSNQVVGIRKSANISIPKVPKPMLPQDLDDHDVYLSWPFPTLEDVRPDEWMSLGEFPHFILCEAKGPGGVKMTLWCLPFRAFNTKTSSNAIKRLSQRVLHHIKYLEISAFT